MIREMKRTWDAGKGKDQTHLTYTFVCDNVEEFDFASSLIAKWQEYKRKRKSTESKFMKG